MADEGTGSARNAVWIAAIPAVFGLLGGALSGGLTAYVQLSTKREEYSIQRAQEFQKLMKDLSDEQEKTARLAVLNLWQLYPEERDRRIITAAAFAVNQPDLVDVIRGIDEELAPVSDMLRARAVSADTQVSEPALRTLISLDPVGAASVLIDRLEADIAVNGGRMRSYGSRIDPIRELTRLVEEEDTVEDMVRDGVGGRSRLLFDYILYRSDRRSDFVEKLVEAFGSGSDLDVPNDHLLRADFKPRDQKAVLTAAGGFVTRSLAAGEKDNFDVVDTLLGLRNRDLNRGLATVLGDAFATTLVSAVLDRENNDALRARALVLLRTMSPERALEGVAGSLATGPPPTELREAINRVLTGGLIAQLERDGPILDLPCDQTKPGTCVEASAEDWQAWRDGRER